MSESNGKNGAGSIIGHEIRDAQPIEPKPLVKCGLCGQSALQLKDRLSVHYPSLGATRPCVKSWPEDKAKK